MNIVFIHGRGQGHRSESEIRTNWLEGLDNGYRQLDRRPVSRSTILPPFYGAILDRLTAARESPTGHAVERGASATHEAVDPFTAAMVERIARRAGVDEQEAMITASVPVVERGFRDLAWVQALAEAAERRAPWLAALGIEHFVADVHAYMTLPTVRRAVHDVVRPAITAGPCVVVAHSLGTIVAYQLLTELADRAHATLLVTAGSPLGIGVIRHNLRPPLGIPTGVQAWLNASDPRDFVALAERLDARTFVGGIDNIDDVRNPFEPHDIRGYLADTRVVRRIIAALN